MTNKRRLRIDLNILVLLLVFAINDQLQAQTAGVNYQALILNTETIEVPGNNISQGQIPLSKKDVYFRFSITGDTETGYTKYYEEEQLAETDSNGLVSLVVGDGLPLFSSFISIVWDGTPKYLNVEIDISGIGETYSFLDSQKILYLPQSGTGSAGASNGISIEGNILILGGNLTKPTIIRTSSDNTLSFRGLPIGNLIEDDIIVSNRNTGVLKRIDGTSINYVKERRVVATNGQNRFISPLPIENSDKINLYRNGIRIDFTVIDESTLELEAGVVCNKDDEIRIVQFN